MPVAKRMSAGFTLLELMIVIVVVAVLATIALPVYQDSKIRSQRATGKGMLYDVATRQEQYFINNKDYATALTELGYSSVYYVDSKANSVLLADSIYKIELSSISSVDVILALPQNVQVKDSCGTLTLKMNGEKLPTTEGCW